MKVVHKHKIDRMLMHLKVICAKVIDFGVDPKGNLCVWTEQGNNESVYLLQVICTGQEIMPEYDHVASNRDGDFIWHLYARKVP